MVIVGLKKKMDEMMSKNTERQNNTILHLEDVYKRYINQNKKEFTVLNDIDLKVNSGEFVSVIGPSGCGKSTLLRLILGSEQPSDGTVLFNNNKIIGPDRDRGIVFQKYSLFPHLSILDNIAFGLDAEKFSIPGRIFNPFLYSKKKKAFRIEAGEYLERVGLKDDGDKYPHQLSGGMRQRAAIAQSLIMKPKILLMDEPFGALDDSTRQDMQLFLLEQWEREKMTVFFVTHDLEEAIFLGSRIIVLSQYYSTDKLSNEGSKIVSDLKISDKTTKPTSFKYTEECSKLIKKVRHEGLDPMHRQHIKEFELNHKDSFRTVTKEEWKNN